MKEKFSNSPLVEIIAEVRWDIDSVPANQALAKADADWYGAAFERFVKKASDLGYRSSERLLPKDFPIFTGQPVVRCRYVGAPTEPGPGLDATLMQLGAGMFSVNGVQPYSSWDEFGPAVCSGLETLESLLSENRSVGSVKPILRYIDAFEVNLTGGRSLKAFIEDVFGFGFALPAALTSQVGGRETELGGLALTVPLEMGQLIVKLGQGAVADRPAIICDMTVSFDADVALSSDAIMASFNEARDVIHKAFVELTRPIHALMNEGE